MAFSLSRCNILRLLESLSRPKNRRSVSFRAEFTTFEETKWNYYDIKDKRDDTESSAFEKNDPRKRWTNRDDSTSDWQIEELERRQLDQRSVVTYRNCKVTNHRARANVPVNALDGDELVSAICHNVLGIERELSLEDLYNHFRTFSPVNTGPVGGMELMETLKTQAERLLHRRKLSMDQMVKLLVIYDRLGCLSHEFRNLVQSHMFLSVHRFTPFQVIATFEVFARHRARYEGFLNLLCLIFYDHMIPLLKSQSEGGEVELRHVLHLLEVMDDFSFKRLTDVLYAQVYDNVDTLTRDEMVRVAATFFRNKRDPNFVELYTKLLSNILKMPKLSLDNFERHVKQTLNLGEEALLEDMGAVGGVESIVVDDVGSLRAIFDCRSEFLLSSVHHRVEFKRLWRHNIETNNVSWKVPSPTSADSADTPLLDSPEEPVSPPVGSLTVGPRASYAENFPDLYEKIEGAILRGFKFGTHTREFLTGLIATVEDYSRYAAGPNTKNILANLYSLLPSCSKGSEGWLEAMKRLAPRTIMRHIHAYFYRIDPMCEFYRADEVNFYKPNFTTSLLFSGDGTLYSLLIRSFNSYLVSGQDLPSKPPISELCHLFEAVVHPFYCSRRLASKPFLALSILHMAGRLNDKSISSLSAVSLNCQEPQSLPVCSALSSDLATFTKLASEYMGSRLCDQFSMAERIGALKTLVSLRVCNPELAQGSEVQKFVESSVAVLMEYFRANGKEDLEEGVTVGQDLRLFDWITDALALEPSKLVYDLLAECLKVVDSRIGYYGLPELVLLGSCLSASLRHFASLDLEREELLENLDQRLRILRRETLEAFAKLGPKEPEFNPETAAAFNLLMMYHLF